MKIHCISFLLDIIFIGYIALVLSMYMVTFIFIVLGHAQANARSQHLGFTEPVVISQG